MGTNFYIRQKIKDEDKKAIRDLLDKDDMEGVKNYAEEHPNEIHIGKRSYGWKFLWDAHEFRYFKPTKESLHEFLRAHDIYDEYGRKYTFEQFINDIPIIMGDDLKSYYEADKSKIEALAHPNDITRFETSTGIVPNRYGEFYIDNYRFTIHEDFA